MQCCPLASVKQRISVGSPLPFNVRNADRTLLLASGHVIATAEQLEALFERGALVDIDELKPRAPDPRECPADELPALWEKTFDRVGMVLKSSVHTDFIAALDLACAPVSALIERDPDLAIFQVVRQDTVGGQYGVSHSMHAAIAARLAAGRLGWDKPEANKVFKAALTMNLSMLELQGRLALQTTPPTPLQREAIHSHPLRSVEMLKEAGVADADWLEAIAQHHETPNGRGYPMGLTEVNEMASLLRRADVYTAKLSARATRAPMPAHEAARIMFVQDHGHPMVAALIKEFGVYPPGTCVRLASGEVGLVVRRGPATNTPVVAAVTNRHGDAMMEPVRRATTAKEHAIVDVLDEKALKVRVTREQLAQAASC